jgi:hypothetical protein
MGARGREVDRSELRPGAAVGAERGKGTGRGNRRCLDPGHRLQQAVRWPVRPVGTNGRGLAQPPWHESSLMDPTPPDQHPEPRRASRSWTSIQILDACRPFLGP